jgi:hypothetical protein
MSKKHSKKTASNHKSHGHAKANAVAAAAHLDDARLPAIGTVIRKTDRHGNVRCTCRVVTQGIRYNGTVYRSLSAAAMAAASDLGLGSATQNGFVFWALT